MQVKLYAKVIKSYLILGDYIIILVTLQIKINNMQDFKNISTYKEALKDKILTTAMTAFARNGIRAVKMDDIANALSISKRTLYEVYRNKEDLLFEGVRKFNRERTEAMQRFASGDVNVMDIILHSFKMTIEEFKFTNPVFYSDLLKYPKILEFFEEDKKNGIVSENGSLYYSVDGVVTGAGLMKIDGSYYYVKTSTGEVVHDRIYWITSTNDLLPAGQYEFGSGGKMVNPPVVDPDDPEPELKDGIVEENGSLYYYVEGVLTPAGLIQIDGDFYYVRTSNCEVVHDRTYWVTATNNLLPSGQYEFGPDGKLILE